MKEIIKKWAKKTKDTNSIKKQAKLQYNQFYYTKHILSDEN